MCTAGRVSVDLKIAKALYHTHIQLLAHTVETEAVTLGLGLLTRGGLPVEPVAGAEALNPGDVSDTLRRAVIH